MKREKGGAVVIEELDELVQVIGSPAYFFDTATLRILAVNAQFARLMEYTEAQLLAMTIDALRHGEEVAKMRKALTQSPPQGSVEWRYLTGKGQILYVQITYRNSTFVERGSLEARDIRMVVISKWATAPLQSADDLFG